MSAWGGGDGASSGLAGRVQPDGATPGDRQTTAVVIGIGVIIVLVAAIAVVWRSGDAPGQSGGQRADVDLRTALLTLDDVGEGYEPYPFDDDDEGVYEGGPGCGPLMAIFNEPPRRGMSDAQALFRDVSDERIRNVVHRIDWADEYPRELEELAAAIETCTSYSWHAEGDTALVTLERIEMEEVGDVTLIFVQDADFNRADGTRTSFTFVTLMWERGDVRSSLVRSEGWFSGEPGRPPRSMLTETVQELGQLLDRRLVETLGS